MEESAPEPGNKKRAVGTRLTVVARQLWQRFDRLVGEIGVSRAQWRLIAVVSLRPGATQRVVAEALEISEVSAGRLIDRLCAEGYLERRESAADRRAHSVYLTQAAQPVLDRLSELARVEENEAFAGFAKHELDKLESLLDRIAHNVAVARGDFARVPPAKSGSGPTLEEAALQKSSASA
jgi:DNA-binding MarR family transcriptional regulator